MKRSLWSGRTWAFVALACLGAEFSTAQARDVVYGRSDNCSDREIVAIVDPSTKCSRFSDTDIAWSIKVNGRCINITDTNVQNACSQVQLRQAGSNVSAVYGRSDNCSDASVASIVNEFTECAKLSNEAVAWSIKVDGRCRNITDTNVRNACNQVKLAQAGSNADAVYGRSDNCSASSIAAVIDKRTECSSLSDSDVAWSIKVNVRCRNITDTNVRNACNQVKVAQGGSNSDAVYGRSDSCSASTIEAIVDNRTDCLKLSDQTDAWSIKVNGRCQNITDTNVRSACSQVQAQKAGSNLSAVYGRSDNCSASAILSKVDSETRCARFPNDGVAWSIRVNGRCQNITDTNPQSACSQIKSQLGGNIDTIYGRSDSCSQSAIALTVSPETSCQKLSDSDIAWSIKVGGRCINITDTNVRAACHQVQLKQAGANANAVYGRSDNCSDQLVTQVVGRKTRCERLSNEDAAWSIKVNGRCRNITDTNQRNACNQVKSQIGGSDAANAVYGRSDNCSAGAILATITGRSKCERYSNTQAAWSIKVKGRCISISDTNVRNACNQVKSRLEPQRPEDPTDPGDDKPCNYEKLQQCLDFAGGDACYEKWHCEKP